MAEITDILTEDKETQVEGHDEMKAMKTEMEAHLKQIMQEKMNELELKVDNKMNQLTKDLDGIKANLHAQRERQTNCEMQLNAVGVSDMNRVPMFEETRVEIEKIKLEQTRLALKAKEDLEIVYTTKGRADVLIQLLEQKDEKLIKELNELKTKVGIMMDVYKNQLEELKTTIASVDKDRGKEPRALEQMESKIIEMMMKDLQNQHERLDIMKKLSQDGRCREMDETNLNGTELVQKVEKMEAQMQKDGDDIRLNVDNQMTAINKQLETIENRVTENDNKLAAFDNKVTIMGNEVATIDNRVTENENKLAAFDNKMTIMGNEVATIDNRVTTDDNEITIINNNLITIEKKVDDMDNRMRTTDKKVEIINNLFKTTDKKTETIDKRISTTDKKVDATDNQIAGIDNKVSAIYNRLTWMESWQKKHLNIGIFGTLRQIDGCQVSEFTFTVRNIEEEITRARGDEYHHIDSEPFYTNIMGYRAKLQVYPNHNNKNSLGVFLCLVEGEFDDFVAWPFNCHYEFQSVSRDGTQIASCVIDTSTSSQEALRRPPANNSSGLGIWEYISSEKLLTNKDQYVIEGGFSIKATIWLSD